MLLHAAQDEQLLVRSCAHASLIHAARGCRRGLWEQECASFDNEIRARVHRWARIQPGEDPPSVTQITLPLRWGGLALRSLSSMGPSARVGSAAAVLWNLPLIAPVLRGVWALGWRELAAALGEPPPPALPVPVVQPVRLPQLLGDLVADAVELQGGLVAARADTMLALESSSEFAPALVEDLRLALHEWPEVSAVGIFESGSAFFQHATTRALELGDGCRLFFNGVLPGSSVSAEVWAGSMSCLGPESGLWLDHPRDSQQTSFTNEAFAVALRLRFQMCPWPGWDGDWLCSCAFCCAGGRAAPPSIRALGCKLGGFVDRRHNALMDGMLEIGREAGCPCFWRNPSWRKLGVPGAAHGGNKVDGAFPSGPLGRAVCFDVRVTDPRGRSSLPLAISRWGGAALDACREKVSKHAAAVGRAGWDFRPLVWEVMGFAAHPVGEFLGMLASHKFGAGGLGMSSLRASVLRGWRCRLSVLLQRGNAQCVLGRLSRGVLGLGPGVPAVMECSEDSSVAGGTSDEEYEFFSDVSSHATEPVGSSTQGSGASRGVVAGGSGSGPGHGAGPGLGMGLGSAVGLGLGVGAGVGMGLGMGTGSGLSGRGQNGRRPRGRSAPQPWRRAR